MDRASNMLNLFPRGSTSPQSLNSNLNQPQQQQQPQQASPPQSYREPPPPSPPKTIEALFQNINTQPSQSLPAPQSSTNPFTARSAQVNVPSAPGTPVSSVTAASAASSSTGNPTAERQSALLSLLGTVSTTAPNQDILTPFSSPPVGQISSHAQVPTPPTSDPRPTSNEAQGKFLLEQLMAGNNPKSSYDESSHSSFLPTVNSPYPPRPYGPPESDQYIPQNAYNTSEIAREPPRPAPLPPQPPSPRKSMFDFVSPFDTFASGPQQPKKKVDPAANVRDSEDSSWTSVSDPKRKSMENLMDQLTRSQISLTQNQYDSYGPDTYSTQFEASQSQSRTIPQPKPSSGSPRSSPPKMPQTSQQQQQRLPPQTRQPESSLNTTAVQPPPFLTSREKPASPPPQYSWKSETLSKPRAGSIRGKGGSGQLSQPQSIVFDVSQALDSVQASRDCVKSTPIALVKVEPTFLPGTTIGATHWVAYGMSKGRVRVISRSSGDRTLLQLPSQFSPAASVTDMAVYGNRLAGVTSDGGFVVWELPDVINDDVPGRLLLYVLPSNNDYEPLQSVKWHPREKDTLSVASDTTVYILDLLEISRTYRGDQPIYQSDLQQLSRWFEVPSPLVAFDFDVDHYAIGTVCRDSTFTLWNITDRQPFWSRKVNGEGSPSSVTFLEHGVVIGRKNGTIFQLLPIMSEEALSTVKFVNGPKDDPDMFGHVTYDRRIETLWIANSRRDSLIAFKVFFDSPPEGEDAPSWGCFDQVVEFIGPKPTIHFVILTADADPHGDEAQAACVAAKVPPGPLALVAFSVHNSGVDQILIRQEWFESALTSTTSKLPPYTHVAPQVQAPAAPAPEKRQQPLSGPPPMTVQNLSHPVPSVPVRLRTPPSEEVEIDQSKEESTPRENKNKGLKGKNVVWKDKEEPAKEKNNSNNSKGTDNSILNDSPLGVALTKEIRKVEENLHTRIGRLIARELDRQQQRLEEARANEQAADFVRQEKILKLISTELTKNTTRVVETAVKGEVQSSVLPSLENITKNEVKMALSSQVTRGLGESIRTNLPPEIEKLLVKPEVSTQIARNISANITPVIERQMKESVSKVLVPAYQAQTTLAHQEFTREMHAEMNNMKRDMINWQSEALRGQETLIREMEKTIRTLSEQVKYLAMNMPSAAPTTLGIAPRPIQSSSGSAQYNPSPQTQMTPPHHIQTNFPTIGSQPPTGYQYQQQPAPPAAPPSQWYSTPPIGSSSSQAQVTPPPPVSAGQAKQKKEDWDEIYMTVLSTRDLKQLRDLLSRSNPDVVMPTSGSGPLSQAVVLTLLHRLAAGIGETSTVDEAFKLSLWWMKRAATTLNTNDNLILPYAGRVIPDIVATLKTTKQRSLLPGGHQLLDATHSISEIQDILSRKPIVQ